MIQPLRLCGNDDHTNGRHLESVKNLNCSRLLLVGVSARFVQSLFAFDPPFYREK